MQKARLNAVMKCTNHTVTFNYTKHTLTVAPATGPAWSTHGANWNGVELYSDTTEPSVNPFSGSPPSVIFRTDGTAGHTGSTIRAGSDISGETPPTITNDTA